MTTEYSTEKVTELIAEARKYVSDHDVYADNHLLRDLAAALEAVAADRDKAIDGLFRAVKALGFDTDDAANADEFFGPQTYCADGARYTDPWDIAVAYAADYRSEMEEEADQIEAERHDALQRMLALDQANDEIIDQAEKAEAERDELRAVIEATEDWVTRHYLDTHMGEKVLAILSRIHEHDDKEQN